MPSHQQLFAPTVISGVISRFAAADVEPILRIFGIQFGGPNVENVGRRFYQYDIFNQTRTVALSTAPGTPAATIRRQSAGTVSGQFLRLHEHLDLPYEKFNNLRPIGGQGNQYDVMAAQQFRNQQQFMGQRARNWRLMLLCGFLRGLMYGHQTAGKDGLYYDFTSANAVTTVDWKRPSGNTGKLNMLGAGDILGDWSDPQTDIPGQLAKVNQAMIQLYGAPLQLMVLNSTTFQKIVNNDFVIQQAGIADSPWNYFSRSEAVGSNGLPNTYMIAQLKAMPWINWVIVDTGIILGDLSTAPTIESGTASTYTPLLPDGYIWGGPNPSNDYFKMLIGSEPISDGHGAPAVERMGLYAWTKETDQPAGKQLFTVDNAMLANFVPASNFWAQAYTA